MNRIMMNFIKVLTSLVCFLNFTNFNFGFNGQQLVRELGTKLCPYTNFCSSEAAKENLNVSLTPCCRPCLCDDGCWELDNCCPDKQTKTPASSDLIPCKNTKVKSPRIDSIFETMAKGSEHFRVIDTCPSTEANLTLIGLCMGDNQTVLEDFIWVSDYIDGKIYQNLHCATCHRIDSYISWQIKTTCGDILHGDFVHVEEVLLLSYYCDIINVVPDALQAKTVKYECYENISPTHTTCTDFPHEQLGNHSQDIMAACEHSSWAYISGIFAHKNVFCYICKNGLETVRKDLCDSEELHVRGDKDRFSAIINYHEKPVKDETKENSGCHSNEVLDKHMGRCHKLICPFGRAPLFGRCELISSNFDYLYIGIHFYLETRRPQTKLTENNNTVIGRVIHRQFSEYLGWEKAGCGSRESYIKVANKTAPPAGFLVQYKLRTTSTCQPDFIQQQASDALGTMITVNITGDVLVVCVRPSKWYKDDLTQMSQIYYFEDTDQHLRLMFTTSVTLDAEIFCPKIELKLSYAEIFSAFKEKEKLVFLSFFEAADVQNDSDTIYVCQEHYFTVLSLTNACLCLKVMEAYFFAGFIMYILF